jgi:uncharacterized protein YdcH (DUF465 family)
MEYYTEDEESNSSLSGDEQFALWKERHAELQRKIEAIEMRPYITESDDLEGQRLKKLKLQVKDRMSEMLSVRQSRAASA